MQRIYALFALFIIALLGACAGADNNRINLRGKPDPFKSVARPPLTRAVDGILSKPLPSGIASKDQSYLFAAQTALFGRELPNGAPLTALDQNFITALGGNLDPRVPLDFDREILDRTANKSTGPNNPIAKALKPLQSRSSQTGKIINPLYEWQMIRRQLVTAAPPPFAKPGYTIDLVQQGRIRSK